MPFNPRRAASKRGFVDDVRQFGAGITGRAARDHLKIDAFRELHFLGMDAQNFFAAFHVGQIDRDLAIETTGTQQRGIEHIGTVRGGDDDDAFLRVEAVHLHEQRIQRLLAFVVSAADAVTAMTTDRVDFVDENDARRGLLALLEHVAHAAGADADKHLDEIRAADREERHVRFAGNGAGEQGFAGSRRSDEQARLSECGRRVSETFSGRAETRPAPVTSSFASSTPATSLNVILFLSRASMRAFDLPKLSAPLPAMRICWRKRK